MAVAGCINAYDCAGCYLTTLQQLQSDNIGVAINYTAPGEYGRRQLDYIKYTDKCGCTCCLTGENELRIVATQGVIKNFTLTNDDTNEVVNVKWNDLFGSNRAYTMVRYKTGSYPTSISDGTLAVKETTQNQYSVSGYNVSGLTDGTTYYFTAFAVSQDGTIIVVQNKTITPEFARKPGSNTFLYYSFDGDVLDHSGNGRDGRVQQTITYDMSMGYKGASTGGYGLMPELGTMGTFTTSLWFRTTTTAGGNILTIGSYGNGDNSNLDQNFSNGKLHIQIWKGSNSHEETFSSLTANDGKRHNLIIVKNGTAYSVYFDKTLITSFTDSTTIKGTANGSSYRTHPNFGSGSIFSGDLDEVIIETSAWSVANVNSYYDKMKKYYPN